MVSGDLILVLKNDQKSAKRRRPAEDTPGISGPGEVLTDFGVVL